MITEEQKNAFGFSGKNQLWSEMLKFLQEQQQSLMLEAVSITSHGEDRIHLCGQAEAINYTLSALIELRRQARKLNGLTPDEDLA